MSTAETTGPQAPSVDEPDETPDETPDEDAPEVVPEPIEGDDDDEGTPVPAERLDDGETGDDAASQAARSEKEIEQRMDKLYKEDERHRKRVSEVMGDDAVSLIPCPVCVGQIAGWIFPPELAPLDEEQVMRMRQLLGLVGTEGLNPAKFAERCPDCDGKGEVTTGSYVPGFETTTCKRCGKQGWIPKGAPANGHVEGVPEIPTETGPTVYGLDEPDPEVQHLRERGFTVIPPMNLPQS